MDGASGILIYRRVLWGKNAARETKEEVEAERIGTMRSAKALKVVSVLNRAQIVIRRSGVATQNIVMNFLVVQFVSAIVLFFGKMPLSLVCFIFIRKNKGHTKAPFKYIYLYFSVHQS